MLVGDFTLRGRQGIYSFVLNERAVVICCPSKLKQVENPVSTQGFCWAEEIYLYSQLNSER